MKKFTLTLVLLMVATTQANAASEARRKIRSWAMRMEGKNVVTASMAPSAVAEKKKEEPKKEAEPKKTNRTE